MTNPRQQSVKQSVTNSQRNGAGQRFNSFYWRVPVAREPEFTGGGFTGGGEDGPLGGGVRLVLVSLGVELSQCGHHPLTAHLVSQPVAA